MTMLRGVPITAPIRLSDLPADELRVALFARADQKRARWLQRYNTPRKVGLIERMRGALRRG